MGIPVADRLHGRCLGLGFLRSKFLPPPLASSPASNGFLGQQCRRVHWAERKSTFQRFVRKLETRLDSSDWCILFEVAERISHSRGAVIGKELLWDAHWSKKKMLSFVIFYGCIPDIYEWALTRASEPTSVCVYLKLLILTQSTREESMILFISVTCYSLISIVTFPCFIQSEGEKQHRSCQNILLSHISG